MVADLQDSDSCLLEFMLLCNPLPRCIGLTHVIIRRSQMLRDFWDQVIKTTGFCLAFWDHLFWGRQPLYCDDEDSSP